MHVTIVACLHPLSKVLLHSYIIVSLTFELLVLRRRSGLKEVEVFPYYSYIAIEGWQIIIFGDLSTWEKTAGNEVEQISACHIKIDQQNGHTEGKFDT